jgi:predicted ATPase/DNA-binding CsgD family transcriptional regulator
MTFDPPTLLRSEPVPLVSLAGRDAAARLPVPVSPLVGREREAAAVAALLRDPAVRLVTLTGPGGVGKTRLALHVATDLATEFADGAAFVELASLREPTLLASTIVQALGIRRADDAPALTTLQSILRARELLLVLDSFEQVVAAGPVVIALLQTCPHLKALVTSRTLLHVSGEQAAPVPPLSLPNRGVAESGRRATSSLASSPVRLLDSEAVRLFVERSQAVLPTFTLTDANAEAVGEICARLDGLPLAIELAAARSALFPPLALLARLERRLPLLTAGARDLPSRQRTMRDAISWSHDLLSPAEQAVFRRLSVFVGGSALEAVEAVCAGPETQRDAAATANSEFDVVTIVESLTRQSLLQAAPAPFNAGETGTPRLTMLETVREFAAEELAAGGDGEAARRHAAYYLALAIRAEQTYWGDAPGDWRATMQVELGNMRAALIWATAHGETDTALQLASTMIAPHWISGDHAREQQEWVHRALAMPGGSAQNRMRALTSAASLAGSQQALTEGRAFVEEALALGRQLGDELGIARASFVLGRAAFHHGDVATSRRCLIEALTRYRAQHARARAAWALCYLASLDSRLAIDEGGDAADLARAARSYEEALAVFRDVDHVRGVARALRGLAYVAYKQRDLRRSLALTREVLSLAWAQQWPVYVYLEDIADIAGRVGTPVVAARLYGAAHEERERYGRPIPPVFREEVERDMAVAKNALGEAAFAADWAAGRALPIAQAIDEALAVSVADADAPRIALTPREREILPLLADGKTDREIGEALFLSRRTVENHVARLRAKLGVSTRAEAVKAARASGLISIETIEGQGK